MKILVVEDNSKKAANVTTLLSSIPGIEKEDITPCADLVTAKRELCDNDFDLLVLDVQVPMRHDEKVELRGGVDFLEEITTRGKYRLPAHIIGLTAYEDSLISAERFFQENGWALVKYSESDIQWEVALRNYASYIFEHQNRQVDQRAELHYGHDLVIICALPQIEFESIAALPFGFDWSPPGRGMQFLDGTYNKNGKTFKIAAMFSPQMGMAPSAVLTMNMIHLLRPRYLAMSGITAGVAGKVNVGDVLIADQSWDYGSGKLAAQDGAQVFLPDPRPITLDPDLKAQFQQLALDHALADEIMRRWPGDKPATPLRLHVGQVPSGAAVIADPSVVEDIVGRNRKVIGLEMENYGFFHAAAHASHPRPMAFSVKSVCDFADQDKGDAFQRYAAYTSAQVVYHFADRYLFN